MERLFQWLATAPILHRAGLLLGLVGGIASYYWFFPLAKANRDIEESKKSVEISMLSVEAQRRKLQQTEKAKMELKDMDKKSKELDKRIPGSVDMSELVGELDQMADDIRINSIVPMDDDTDSYDSVVIKPIVFKIEGRFHSICRFLYKMFQMGRLMDVGDITMAFNQVAVKAKVQDVEKKNILAAEFTARIYYAPTSSTIAALKAAKKK
ncbi:type 4a pilus biogenesis protein PilO [Myxococcota bacterium]|nr:type 4a pilus biogenesis protein PilO [Myxococcota bacterium]MBU1537433.1 type 4a pilus biogenesis protein PilO [Myxococcota bacterium]